MAKIVKCPKCKEIVKQVLVYSECYQVGEVVGDTIEDYGSIEEITETIAIECRNCRHDFYNSGDSKLNW